MRSRVASLALTLVFHAGIATAELLHPEAIEDPTPAELVWRDGDTAGSYVGRLRAAARSWGGDCAAEEEALAKLARGLAVASDADSAVAGKSFALEWTLAEQPDGLPPAWLVVSLDQPVRFAGDGFYALMPGAIGPFGMAAGQERTRALIALQGDAPAAGRIEIMPLVAEPLAVTVEIAGYIRGCGEERIATAAEGTLPVSPSPEPVFFAHDPLSVEQPTRVLAAPDGATRTEVYEGRYRLIEAGTDAVLAEREGTEPNYSPTGRFVSAHSGDFYEIMDAVDGAVVAAVPFGDVGWENADSFVISGQPDHGGVDALSPLVAGYRLGFGDALPDCTVCPGLGTGFTLDLENDVALRLGGQNAIVSRLTGERTAVSSMVDVFDEELMAAVDMEIDRFVAEQTGALPVYKPENWNFRGGLRFSSLAEDYQPTGNAAFDAWLARMKAGLGHAADVPPRPPADPAVLTVNGVGQWRGALRLAPPRPRDDAITTRLKEFGIALEEPRKPDFERRGWLDEADDLAVARRIEAAVPQTAGLFEPRGDFGCLPDTRPDGSIGIFAFFNRAMEFRLGERTLWLTLFSCKWTAGGTFEPNFYLFDSAASEAVIRLGSENPAQPNGGLCTHNIGLCDVEARLDGTRLLIWSHESRALLVYDIDARQPVFVQHDLERGELMKEIRLTADGRHVAQVNNDGSFYVYDTVRATRVLEGRYVDDETMVWTPDLRFDASPEGANYVSLRFPGQRGQHTFQQFSRTVRKPGLVEAVMSGAYAPAAAQTLGVPPRVAGEIRLEEGRIRGAALAPGAVAVRVYQDGLLTDTLAVPVDSGTVRLDLPRAPGARWVSLVAADAAGLVSLPVGRDLPVAAADLPVVHALTVGVDRYESSAIADLAFAGRDARTLIAALDAQDGRSLRLGLSASLTDAEASSGAILATAREMVATAKAGETIMLSFAGHGLTGADSRFYMATGATDLADIAGTALSWEALAAVLVEAKARVVVFLDACHSGAAGTSFFSTNDEAASGVLETIPSGLLVFSASKGRQFSEEAVAMGGGVFTNAIADVIARQRAAFDLDGNGAIEVSELYAGVKRRVSELTEGRQVPWLARNELMGDFALF